jgi:hypothetical protein
MNSSRRAEQKKKEKKKTNTAINTSKSKKLRYDTQSADHRGFSFPISFPKPGQEYEQYQPSVLRKQRPRPCTSRYSSAFQWSEFKIQPIQRASETTTRIYTKINLRTSTIQSKSRKYWRTKSTFKVQYNPIYTENKTPSSRWLPSQ